MPKVTAQTIADLSVMEAELEAAHKFYLQKLGQLAALAREVLAATIADSGVSPHDKGQG
jgi:hypothetical protein